MFLNEQKPVYAIKAFKGYYFENPDDQGLPDSKPQISLMRVFATPEEASMYLEAISPYNKHLGKLTVKAVYLNELREEAKDTHDYSVEYFDAPLNVMFSCIQANEWPVSIETVIHYTEFDRYYTGKEN